MPHLAPVKCTSTSPARPSPRPLLRVSLPVSFPSHSRESKGLFARPLRPQLQSSCEASEPLCQPGLSSAAIEEEGRKDGSEFKLKLNGASDTKKKLLRAIACLSVVLALKFALPAAVLAAKKTAAAAAGTGAGASTGAGWLGPFKGIVDFILHLDDKLGAIIAEHGTATYAILFAIVFCETGLVLTPFLPGDSLLFASGAFAGLKKLNILYVLAVFITSAILGDAVNYAIGSWLGEKAIEKGFVSKKAISKTEKFYDKYGGKTIVLARFVPIIRTFAPFVAGISNMSYPKFATYNVFGAIVWTLLFTGVGFFFGNLPFVEKNFSAVVLGIVVVSVLPVVFEVMAARKEEAASGDEPPATASA